MMKPEEFAEKMYQAAVRNDVEVSHMIMDELMCEVLAELGYDEGIGIFERASKYYA